MIKAEVTKNYNGITISGDYYDLSELVDAIYTITNIYDTSDKYYTFSTFFLGLCYDIRHASMGDREFELIDTGLKEDNWFDLDHKSKNIYFSFNYVMVGLLFPIFGFIYRKDELLEMYLNKNRTNVNEVIRTKKAIGILTSFCTLIIEKFYEFIGDDEASKLHRCASKNLFVNDFLGPFISKCDIDYLNTNKDKKKRKIVNILNHIIKQDSVYTNMKEVYEDYAFENNICINALDYNVEYPEEIDW